MVLTEPFAPGGVTSDGVVVGDARDPNDLALFWNLRATGAHVAFWPRDDVLPLEASSVYRVERLLEAPRSRLDRGLELWSTSGWPRDYMLPETLEALLQPSRLRAEDQHRERLRRHEEAGLRD